MNSEDNQDITESFRIESGRILTYMFIYVVLLAVHMLILREIPYALILPILIVMFMHFFYIKYGSKNEISPLYNYSPIWSSVSILFFVLMFIAEIFIGKANVALVIGVFGAIVLTIIYLITLFIIYKDVGL